MSLYVTLAFAEMQVWQRHMQQAPGRWSRLSKGMQNRVNSLIPEKVHAAVTVAIRQMVRGVLFGAAQLTRPATPVLNLEYTEEKVRRRINLYRRMAAVEGGVTGAGGFLAGLADFPLLLGIKLKMLFDIAALYGFDAGDYRERVYLLHVFELSFSSDAHRRAVYQKMEQWPQVAAAMPAQVEAFDWRSFQQEYRDYIDLAKIAQLLPVIGAPVGLVVNHRLLKRLGHNAMQAYRLRLWQQLQSPGE
jgi:hypothetical protein